MQYKEIKQDLFDLPADYTLAHCIACDAYMGAGIATQFVRRYKKMRPHLQGMNLLIGNVVLYPDKNKHDVLNLITKERSNGKPTRASFNFTIDNLKEFAVRMGIKKIGMPLIGSGLDRLNWKESSDYIQKVFKDTDIEIVVCIKED